jgi:hypothetical protein
MGCGPDTLPTQAPRNPSTRSLCANATLISSKACLSSTSAMQPVDNDHLVREFVNQEDHQPPPDLHLWPAVARGTSLALCMTNAATVAGKDTPNR